MFAYLKGEIAEKAKEKITLDVNGVGYEVYMSSGDVDKL